MYKFKLLLIFIFLLLASSCSKNITIIDSKAHSFWDAAATVILSKSVVFANGTSQAVIKLEVVNTNGTLLEGLVLTAQNFNTDLNFINCTTSNSAGIVHCSFTSISPGTSPIEITDGVKSINTELAFLALPAKLDTVRVSNTQILKNSTPGYTITSGIRKSQASIQDHGGYNFRIETPTLKLNLSSP